MTTITIIFDNSLNSPDNNPPGFKQWVGGDDVHAAPGILVDKTDTELSYTIDSSLSFLLTWYYDGYGWNSGANINGPFVDGQKFQLAKIVK
jgi:hypothetical protein